MARRPTGPPARKGKDRRPAFAARQRLPESAVVLVTGIDRDGDAVARPVEWDGDGPPPQISWPPSRAASRR